MPEQPLILIVDDEPDFLEIFGTKLSSAGFRVETAENAMEGLKKIEDLKPDLVLMDIKMPKMSGADALLKLRENPATKNTKVVFLTCIADQQKEMEAFNERISAEFGAHGFIKKTDNLEALVEKVRTYLGMNA